MAFISSVIELEPEDVVFIKFYDNEHYMRYTLRKKLERTNQVYFLAFASTDTSKNIGLKITAGAYTIMTPDIAPIVDIVVPSSSKYVDIKRRISERYIRVAESKSNIVVIKHVASAVKQTIKSNTMEQIKHLIKIDKMYKSIGDLVFNNLDDTDEYLKKTYTRIFTELVPNEKDLIQIEGIKDLSYRPQLYNLQNNNFHITNISPIVSDSQRIYIDNLEINKAQWLKQVPPKEKKSLLYSCFGAALKDNTLDDAKKVVHLGDIQAEIELHKQAAAKIAADDYDYNSYIKELYTDGQINMIDYQSPTLSYKTSDDIECDYILSNMIHTTKVYRSSHLGQPIFNLVNDIDFLTLESSDNIISRYTQPALYNLKDVLDNISLSQSTKTCGGTDSTSGILYLDPDESTNDKLLKSQSQPPKRDYLYTGEEIKICGFYIHSPGNYTQNIINGPEIILKNNDKIYPPLFSNYLTINDIKSTKQAPNIDIYKDMRDFSARGWANINTHNDNYVLFGQNKLDLGTHQEMYKDYLKKITPTVDNIVHTLLYAELQSASSLIDVEKHLNTYSLSIKDLPSIVMNNIKQTISSGIYRNTSVQVLKHNLYSARQLKKLFSSMVKTFSSAEVSIKKIRTLFAEFYIKEDRMLYILNLFLKKVLLLEINSASTLDEVIEQIKANFKIKIPNSEDIDTSRYTHYRQLSKTYMNQNELNIADARKKLETIATIHSHLDEIIMHHMTALDKSAPPNIDSLLHKTHDEIISLQASYTNFKVKHAITEECIGHTPVKIYNSLVELNMDNGEDVYRDLEFDLMFSILRRAIDISDSDALLETLSLEYFYLTRQTIESIIGDATEVLVKLQANPTMYTKITAILNFNTPIARKHLYNQTIEGLPIRNKVVQGDMALLSIQEGKFLFKRSAAKVWHVLKDADIGDLKLHHTHRNNITDLTLSELNALLLAQDISYLMDSSGCVTIDDYIIDTKLIEFVHRYFSLKDSEQNLSIIKKYTATVESRKQQLELIILNNKHTIVLSNTRRANTIQAVFNPNIQQDTIPLEIRDTLNSIYSIPNLPLRTAKLVEFVDLYGIDFNIYGLEDTPETHSKSALYWYYSSTQFEKKICCKHEYDWKHVFEKTCNMDTFVSKWCDRVVEGFRVCKYCGEQICPEEYSSFTGYDADNRRIEFREKEYVPNIIKDSGAVLDKFLLFEDISSKLIRTSRSPTMKLLIPMTQKIIKNILITPNFTRVDFDLLIDYCTTYERDNTAHITHKFYENYSSLIQYTIDNTPDAIQTALTRQKSLGALLNVQDIPAKAELLSILQSYVNVHIPEMVINLETLTLKDATALMSKTKTLSLDSTPLIPIMLTVYVKHIHASLSSFMLYMVSVEMCSYLTLLVQYKYSSVRAIGQAPRADRTGPILKNLIFDRDNIMENIQNNYQKSVKYTSSALSTRLREINKLPLRTADLQTEHTLIGGLYMVLKHYFTSLQYGTGGSFKDNLSEDLTASIETLLETQTLKLLKKRAMDSVLTVDLGKHSIWNRFLPKLQFVSGPVKKIRVSRHIYERSDQFIYQCNRLINMISSTESSFKQYTTSVFFSDIGKQYYDFITESTIRERLLPDVVEDGLTVLANIRLLYDKLPKTKEILKSSLMFQFVNNNSLEGREVVAPIQRDYVSELLTLLTLYCINVNDTIPEIITQKRIYTKIENPFYSILFNFSLEPIETVSLQALTDQIHERLTMLGDDEYTKKYISEEYIRLMSFDDVDRLRHYISNIDSKRELEIDILSGEARHVVLYDSRQTLKDMSPSLLLSKLKEIEAAVAPTYTPVSKIFEAYSETKDVLYSQIKTDGVPNSESQISMPANILDATYKAYLTELKQELSIYLDGEALTAETAYFEKKYATVKQNKLFSMRIYVIKTFIFYILSIERRFMNTTKKTFIDSSDQSQWSNVQLFGFTDISTKQLARLKIVSASIPTSTLDFSNITLNIKHIRQYINRATIENIEHLENIIAYLSNVLSSLNVPTETIVSEIEYYKELLSVSEVDISRNMERQKINENNYRKDVFEEKNAEDRLTYKLFRAQGLGNFLNDQQNMLVEGAEGDEDGGDEDGYDIADPNADV